jgi:signal transduction histidine kinase
MSRARPFAFNNARLVDPETGYDGPGAVVVSGGVIADIARGRDFTDLSSDVRVIDCNGGMLAPGLVDLRVKTGEPGAETKETLRSAAQAAAAGGVTSIVVQPDTDPAVSAALGAAVREGRPWTAEVLNYRADGQTFWNRLTLFPVGGTPGRPNHFVGYQIDVTAVRAAQAEREQMMSEIQESQKLESLGVLVAGVAHEVNNPLGIALTAATHMAQSAQDILTDLRSHRLVDEDLAAYLEDERVAFDLIVANLKRAADLVRSLKDVAADQAHEHRREVQAAQFLSTLTTSLAPVVKRARCRLELEVDGDFPMEVDTGAFAQLVTNLVVNATVHAFEALEADRPRVIRLTARQVPESPDIELCVQDNGVGIAAALADRIFEPFFTTRRGQGGTGLGLFVVHRIVTQNLGGSIRLEAVQPHGTRFVMRFPQRLQKGVVA